MSSKEELKMKLKASIEAGKISRMGENGWERLEELEDELKDSAKGKRKSYLKILVPILTQKLEDIAESHVGEFAEYADTTGGSGFGGGAGTDAG